VDRTDYTIKGIFIQDQRQPNEKVTIAAEGAKIENNPHAILFRLTDGMITRAAKDLKEAQAVLFKNYDFVVPLDEVVGRERAAYIGRSESTLGEIYSRVKTAPNTETYIAWSFEMHQRIAYPAACLILGLLGPPLGSIFRQKGRMTGITIGVAIFLIYYVLLSAARSLGDSGMISPFFGVWTPNLLCFALAVYLWIKMHRETPFMVAFLRRPLARLLWQGSEARQRHGAAAH